MRFNLKSCILLNGRASCTCHVTSFFPPFFSPGPPPSPWLAPTGPAELSLSHRLIQSSPQPMAARAAPSRDLHPPPAPFAPITQRSNHRRFFQELPEASGIFQKDETSLKLPLPSPSIGDYPQLLCPIESKRLYGSSTHRLIDY